MFNEKELSAGSFRRVETEAEAILVVRVGNRVHALTNRCAHMACSLDKGTLEDFVIKCPCHDWAYDVRTGEFLAAPEIRLPVYSAKIEDGGVYVDL